MKTQRYAAPAVKGLMCMIFDIGSLIWDQTFPNPNVYKPISFYLISSITVIDRLLKRIKKHI